MSPADLWRLDRAFALNLAAISDDGHEKDAHLLYSGAIRSR